MTFSIHQLDNLDFDDAEPLLEDYIIGAIEAFANSDIGQEYAKSHPEGGNWIGTFMEMAFIYGGYTLSKMTRAKVQEVMEYILPRKLTLMDPSDTDDAIDELVAFWTYIHKTYKFRSASAIVKYLRSIEDQFPQWMFDPNRGGMAKSFMMQGMEAGYDMTTPEGLQAFQEEYNQNLPKQPPSPLPGMSGMPAGMGMPGIPTSFTMTTAPADMKAAFEQLGLELPKEGEQVNAKELLTQMMGALEQLDPATAAAFMETLEAEDDSELEPLPSSGSMLPANPVDAPKPLTEADRELLQNQTITTTEPGTIVQDFETTLNFIGEGVPVSSRLQQLSLKLLEDLNQRLSHPVDIDLKRPQQKSYPNIHGLYLLLRATGIAEVAAKGKQFRLVLNPEVQGSWQELNPTEKYFTLLEAWLIRSHPQMLGDNRASIFGVGDRCLRIWPIIGHRGTQTFKDYDYQDNYSYEPGFHNLLLMEMFGLLAITHGKPAKGKGWRMKKFKPLPWGDVVMTVLYNAFSAVGFKWPAESDPTQPFGDLQSVFQPYFPEWQNNLATIRYPFRPGRHIFKVYLGDIWRRIAISGEATLAQFSEWITDSVGFERDHLDQFTYTLPNGRSVQAAHPWAEGDIATDEVRIGDLPLHEGSTLEYVFDFGDWWQFQIQLEAIEPVVTPESAHGVAKVKQTKKRSKSAKRPPMGEILEVHGEAPEQYPDYDEAW